MSWNIYTPARGDSKEVPLNASVVRALWGVRIVFGVTFLVLFTHARNLHGLDLSFIRNQSSSFQSCSRSRRANEVALLAIVYKSLCRREA